MLLPLAHQQAAALFNVLARQECQRGCCKAEGAVCPSEHTLGTWRVRAARARLLHTCLGCSWFPLTSLEFRNGSPKNSPPFPQNRTGFGVSLQTGIAFGATQPGCTARRQNIHTHALLTIGFPRTNWARIQLCCGCSELGRGVFSLFSFVLIALSIFKKPRRPSNTTVL